MSGIQFKTPQAMPRNYAIIEFDDVGFPDFQCEAWTSAPVYMTEKLKTSQDETELRELMLDLFPSWNFVDLNGAPIEHSIEGMNHFATPLIGAMIMKYLYIISEQGIPESFRKASSAISSTVKPTTLDPLP